MLLYPMQTRATPIHDTLLRASEPNDFRIMQLEASGDTISIARVDYNGENKWCLTSSNQGVSWDSTDIPDSPRTFIQYNLPLISGMFLSFIESADPQRMLFTRDGRNFEWQVFRDYGLDSSYYVKKIIVDPIHPNRTILITTTGNFKYDYAWYRDSDTAQWKRLPLPVHSALHGRLVTLSFDYGGTGKLWAIVDATVNGHYDVRDEYFYTDSIGGAWTRIPTRVPAFIGIWNENEGFLFENEQTKPGSDIYVFRALNINTITGQIDTLPWLSTIKAQYPQLNSSETNIRIFGGNAAIEGPGYNVGLFMADCRNRQRIAVAVVAENTARSSSTEWWFESLDRGKTWNVVDTITNAISEPDHQDRNRVSPPTYQSNDSSRYWIKTRSWLNQSYKSFLEQEVLIRNNVVGTSVSDSLFNDNIRVWPNPVSGILRFSIPHSATCSVLNVVGIVVVDNITYEVGQTSFVNVTQLQSGLYFLKIEYDEKVSYAKFLVVK